MAGLVIGFRETLEAAVIIVFILAAVRRLGHGHLAPLTGYGLGAGLLLGVSVATGLASVRVGVSDQSFVTLQLATYGLALLALTWLGIWMRRRGRPVAADANEATEAPGAWLVLAAAFFAVLPQSLELAVRLAAQPSMVDVATAAVGLMGAVALAGLLYLGLLRCHPARFFRSVAHRPLAPAAQEVDE